MINKQRSTIQLFNHSQETLRHELDHIQGRLSKLIDMHLDGTLSKEAYLAKVEEYKSRQREIAAEMEAHVAGDENSLITIQSLFAFAQRTKELFASSNMDEKRQLLKFVFSNLKLDG